jgi:hypothetical protein
MVRRVIWLYAFFFVVLNSSMPAQQRVIVTTSSPSPNVVLVSPQDPTFDATARRLLGAAASGPALDLKPFLVIVSNRSTDTIVAYQVAWKITNTNQTAEYVYTNFMYPDGVMPAILASRDQQPLVPGDDRLVGPEFQLDPSWTAANVQDVLLGTIQDQQTEIPRVERLDISLNAVIFADGLLVGPDTQDFSKIFAIYVDEKQKWLRQVVGDLDAGHSINEAFETMSQVRQQLPPTSPNPDFSAYYRREAAAEIFNLRKSIGDDAVSSVFRKAIRTEPFVIRRSP